jgi:uncharacterized membrane protein
MKHLNKIFVRGLVTVLPILLTIYLLTWSMMVTEDVFGGALRTVLPKEFYIPGLGVLLTLLVIFLVGLSTNHFIAEKFLTNVQLRLTQVPFIKVIYSPLRDLMNLFSKKDDGENKRVVLIKIGDQGIKALGLVTRDSFYDLPAPLNDNQQVAVYIPFSYGLGGFTFLVHRSQIEELDISIEKAMSLAITGWVKADSPGGRRPDIDPKEAHVDPT